MEPSGMLRGSGLSQTMVDSLFLSVVFVVIYLGSKRFGTESKSKP